MLDLDDIDSVSLDIEAIKRGGLAEFVRLAWDVIPSPQPLSWSWHHDLIADHLEAVRHKELNRLIITVPPATGKTKLVSVMFPAWVWTMLPRARVMSATYSSELTRDSARASRSLIRSKWYAERFPQAVLAKGADAADTITVFDNIAGGKRYSVTCEGQITGFHANIQIVDDPTNPDDIKQGGVAAQNALERTWLWWNTVMPSRAIGSNFSRVIIMQRLCEGDLVDRIMNSPAAVDYTHISLPMEFEPGNRCETKWGCDIRTTEGALLCPDFITAETLALKKRETIPQVYAAQYQQRPAPAEGNIFLREWFKERWKVMPSLDGMTLVQSWDCTFKGGPNSDFVAGHIWGYKQGKFYLLDRVHDRMGFPETCRCIESWARKWPHAYGKLIENAANGPAIEQTLRDKLSGLILVKPQDIGGSKEARAHSIAPFAMAGNIILPDPSIHPWVDQVFEELVTFPHARHDDDVDATTMAILHLSGRSHAKYLSAMSKVASGQLSRYLGG